MEDKKSGMTNERMDEWSNAHPGITTYRFVSNQNYESYFNIGNVNVMFI